MTQLQIPAGTERRKRSLPGTPDPEAEVIALSPKTLLATNRFVCEICNKGFQRDQNLQLHRRGHNLPWKLRQRTNKDVPKKVYVCPEPSCVHHDLARALGDLTGIKKHFCRKHGEKKWKCDKCSRCYAVQSDWKAHSKTCGTRQYRCNCGTLFSRKDSFITHRAFCDALAEESARVNAAAASNVSLNPQHTSVSTSCFASAPSSLPLLMGPSPVNNEQATIAGLVEHKDSHFNDFGSITSSCSNLQLELDSQCKQRVPFSIMAMVPDQQRIDFTGSVGSVGYNSSLKCNNILSEQQGLLDLDFDAYPFHKQFNAPSSWAQGYGCQDRSTNNVNNVFNSPAISLQFDSRSPQLADCVTRFGNSEMSFLERSNCIFSAGNSVGRTEHISATAVLQKAAHMGAMACQSRTSYKGLVTSKNYNTTASIHADCDACDSRWNMPLPGAADRSSTSTCGAVSSITNKESCRAWPTSTSCSTIPMMGLLGSTKPDVDITSRDQAVQSLPFKHLQSMSKMTTTVGRKSTQTSHVSCSDLTRPSLMRGDEDDPKLTRDFLGMRQAKNPDLPGTSS